jgi:hypothetical protein
VDADEGAPAKNKGDNHPVAKEDTVITSWEEAELQPEELEDKGFLGECEDNFDII